MKLLEILKERNMSRNKLALSAGINPGDLCCAINGQKPFFPKWQIRVAECLSIDRDELFAEEFQNNSMSNKKEIKKVLDDPMDDENHKYSKLLKILHKKNLSMYRFAINAKISATNFRRVMLNEVDFSEKIKIKISDYLNVKSEDIF